MVGTLARDSGVDAAVSWIAWEKRCRWDGYFDARWLLSGLGTVVQVPEAPPVRESKAPANRGRRWGWPALAVGGQRFPSGQQGSIVKFAARVFSYCGVAAQRGYST